MQFEDICLLSDIKNKLVGSILSYKGEIIRVGGVHSKEKGENVLYYYKLDEKGFGGGALFTDDINTLDVNDFCFERKQLFMFNKEGFGVVFPEDKINKNYGIGLNEAFISLNTLDKGKVRYYSDYLYQCLDPKYPSLPEAFILLERGYKGVAISKTVYLNKNDLGIVVVYHYPSFSPIAWLNNSNLVLNDTPLAKRLTASKNFATAGTLQRIRDALHNSY